MNDTPQTAQSRAPQAAVVIERTYRASVEALWSLWTTKAGFESWWGPEGFRVEVHALEARPGGVLEYDMIADAPEDGLTRRFYEILFDRYPQVRPMFGADIGPQAAMLRTAATISAA